MLVVGASVAVGVVTVQDRDDTRRRREAAEAAEALADAKVATAGDDLAQLTASLADAGARTERDLGDADAIENSVDRLETMRARIVTLEADLAKDVAFRDQRQEPIDLLASCRSTMDAAVDQLRADRSQVGAALVLERGRSGCQQALALVRGNDRAAHPYDFPDPHVLTVGATSYAFATNGPAGMVQVASSTDLRNWRVLPPAVTNVPAWAQPGTTWAPAVIANGGGYVLYYTVRVKGTRQQCISSAISSSPAGPYVDGSAGPLVCQLFLGGSIDPSPHRDEFGGLHLTWKSEGETVGSASKLWTQPVGPDGRTLLGQPVELLGADRAWEGGVIENPSMAKYGNTWVLLYSGNRWNRPDYALGYAVCASAVGPCLKPSGEVVLRSDGSVAGPGGGALFRSPGGQAMVAYAAWDAGQVGYPNSRRLHVAPVAFGPGGLSVG